MAVVPKGQATIARLGSPRVVANLGEIQAANSKMAEELEKVNSDLAQALKGLQEVNNTSDIPYHHTTWIMRLALGCLR